MYSSSVLKARNNVGPRPEPCCTKPRLNDSNFETSPLNDPICVVPIDSVRRPWLQRPGGGVGLWTFTRMYSITQTDATSHNRAKRNCGWLVTRKRCPSQALSLSVHLCLQHVYCDATCRAGSSATADTCPGIDCIERNSEVSVRPLKSNGQGCSLSIFNVLK